MTLPNPLSFHPSSLVSCSFGLLCIHFLISFLQPFLSHPTLNFLHHDTGNFLKGFDPASLQDNSNDLLDHNPPHSPLSATPPSDQDMEDANFSEFSPMSDQQPATHYSTYAAAATRVIHRTPGRSTAMGEASLLINPYYLDLDEVGDDRVSLQDYQEVTNRLLSPL